MARSSSVGSAPTVAPILPTANDLVTVPVAGVSSVTNDEARQAFNVAMMTFGDRIFKEADLIESGHREDTSDVPQFTTKMIVQAEARAREIEYREKPVRPKPKWQPWAEIGHWICTALVGVGSGMAITKSGWLLSPEIWGSIAVFSFIVGLFLTVIVNLAGKDPK